MVLNKWQYCIINKFFRKLRDFQKILRICFKKFNTNSNKMCTILRNFYKYPKFFDRC